jgi:hypothetical protein
MPLSVSIIIDNYNYAQFIRSAIDSCLNQTYPHRQVIVVDDGSTDESREIIRSYGDKIIALFKENGGQATAFNMGFPYATGEIVAFLDSDDYFVPTALEHIISLWKEGVHILHHRLRIVDMTGKLAGYAPHESARLDSGDVLPIQLRAGVYCAPPNSGLVYSRELLSKIMPIPDEIRMGADTYLFSSSPFLAPVVAVEETLCYYRHHGTNAFGMDLPRRLWPMKKLEITRRSYLLRHRIIREQARRHGLPEPDYESWVTSENVFEELLFLRATDPQSLGSRKGWNLVVQTLKKLSKESQGSVHHLRRVFLTFYLWLAPKTLLRLIFPNLF